MITNTPSAADDLRTALLSLRRSVGMKFPAADARRAAMVSVLADARTRIDRINAKAA